MPRNECSHSLGNPCCYFNGIRVKAIYRGYKGLITGEIVEFQTQNVSNIIQQGGTILKSARCQEFRTKEGRQLANEKYEKRRYRCAGGDWR
jgi:6-phosphofructokinase 1